MSLAAAERGTKRGNQKHEHVTKKTVLALYFCQSAISASHDIQWVNYSTSSCTWDSWDAYMGSHSCTCEV